MQPEEIVTLSFTNRDAKVIREKVRGWRCQVDGFYSMKPPHYYY